MTSSETHHSVLPPAPPGGRDSSLDVLAIDFIDVNRSFTLAIQLANLARLWTNQTHQARQVPPAGLGGIGAIAGEIDRLLLDCQYLLPRLAEVVDRYPTEPDTDSEAPLAAPILGPTILIDGTAASLRPRSERDYGGDIAVAAADLAARAVVGAETRRRQLWQEFGRIAQGAAPAALWYDISADVTISFGTTVSLPGWLAVTAQTTIAWLSGQLGVRLT